MDPLSIQMVMGSPPALRGKMSLSNLVGRKKRSPDSDKSSLLKTPKRPAKIDEDPHATPSRQDTVRMRRGFRPLSVLTNSALTPFGSDTLKAMEALQENDGAKYLNQSNIEGDLADGAIGTTTQSADGPLPESSQSLKSPSLSNKSEISLRAFLSQTEPPSRTSQEIKGPFSMLYEIPAPDISQHPAFSSNPFSSQSDAPTLATTSSPNEIKNFAAKARSNSSQLTDRTSASSDVFGSTERKQYTFFGKPLSSCSTPSRETTNNSDISPLAKHKTKSCPIEIDYPLSETPTADAEKKRTSSGGLRKISDIFKPKNSSQKAASSPELDDEESPSTTIREMEKYLRTVTCSPTYPYSDTSWLPRHPNTSRFWRSRNLKCTNCVDVCCACCGRACCAYKAAVMALDTHKDNPKGREEALQRIHQITMVFPYGRETPTFLQCTKGYGNDPGCGKMVCPDCCGVCPDEICADIQCRKCKKNPWAECDWHMNLTPLGPVSDDVRVHLGHTV